MAKRSDFAQKLLDDLRLRKERLAASQSSNRTKPTVADAYALAKRGSRGFKTTETTSFGSRTTQNSSGGGNKSFNTREAAKQIVPFGRGQSSQQVGDLSRALAFALENGSRLKKMDSSGSATMLAFLDQLGRGSMDIKMERKSIMDRHRPSTNNFPTISLVHIEEISRGAQKLNQILRACCNGLNFDRYSIELGKELLKGAIDLEESLRMLVNLQEASEYMVSPQRKNRITLLDEDEDEDDNTVKMAEQKQLDRPRFSFDRPSRNYRDIQEVAKNDLKLRLTALTYPSEATTFVYGKQSAYHKRSASTGSNVKNFSAFSEQKNHPSSSQSKPENGRIPNVIAKLMGLDEFPDKVDSKDITKKDSAKKKVEAKNLKNTRQESTNNTKRTDDTVNLSPPTAKQKAIQSKKIQAVHAVNVTLTAERDLAVANASFHAVIHDTKPPWEELEDKKPAIGFEKGSIKVDKQQNSTGHSNGNIGRLRNIQEKPIEQKGEERSKMKESFLKDELQRMAPQTQKNSDFAVMSSEKTGLREGTFRREDIYSKKVVPVAQDKSQNSPGVQQPHRIRKSESKEEKHLAEERRQQNARQKFATRKQRGSEPIVTALSKQLLDEIDLQKKQSPTNQAAASKQEFTEAVDAMPTKRIPIVRHHEDIVSNRSCSNFNTNIKASANRNSNQDTLPRALELKIAKLKADIPPLMEKKPVQEPDKMKAESIKLHKREIPKKVNEVMIKRSGNLQNSAKTPRQQHSVLQEVKQRSEKLSGPKEANKIRATKSRETEVSIIKSNVSVPSVHAFAAAEQLQKEAEQVSILGCPTEEENQSLAKTKTLSTDDSCPQAIAILMSDQLGEDPAAFNSDEVLKSHIIESNAFDGTHQGSDGISDNLQLEYHKISKSKTPEPLTESENHLKQILIRSHIFLHTAEALFKLNIPFGIIHAGDYQCQDEDSKLPLDCGYEVMKRKGRRQELSVHPFVQVSTTATKARSLNELVKELHKDFDTLKFYGRNQKAEVAVEDYLPKMLENDLYNKDPDVNCMWDLSWKEMMFAFIEKDDVIRDVERCVLNGLVDEITRDLYYFQVRVF